MRTFRHNPLPDRQRHTQTHTLTTITPQACKRHSTQQTCLFSCTHDMYTLYERHMYVDARMRKLTRTSKGTSSRLEARLGVCPLLLELGTTAAWSILCCISDNRFSWRSNHLVSALVVTLSSSQLCSLSLPKFSCSAIFALFFLLGLQSC